jgi:hypothetical protein
MGGFGMSYPIPKSTYYHRLKRAKELGCSIDELPDNRGKHHNHKRGTQHPRWNDAKIISDDGYVKLRVGREHPLADSNGYAYEHLIVWVSAGNPLPGPNELIHHKDEDKQHNVIENLALKKRERHNAEHNAKRFNRKVITEQDVLKIKERRAAGEELKPIAADYGITIQTVSKIVRGERYKNVS